MSKVGLVTAEAYAYEVGEIPDDRSKYRSPFFVSISLINCTAYRIFVRHISQTNPAGTVPGLLGMNLELALGDMPPHCAPEFNIQLHALLYPDRQIAQVLRHFFDIGLDIDLSRMRHDDWLFINGMCFLPGQWDELRMSYPPLESSSSVLTVARTLPDKVILPLIA